MSKVNAVTNTLQFRTPILSSDIANAGNVVIMTGSASPLTGTTSSATGWGVAGRGSLYISTGTKPMLWIMTGTNPNQLIWVRVGTSSSTGGDGTYWV